MEDDSSAAGGANLPRPKSEISDTPSLTSWREELSGAELEMGCAGAGAWERGSAAKKPRRMTPGPGVCLCSPFSVVCSVIRFSAYATVDTQTHQGCSD